MRIKDTLLEIQQLKEENQRLKVDNDFLERQNALLKERCHKLGLENSCLEREIQDMKFTRKYLTSEDAGKAFARSLGVGSQ